VRHKEFALPSEPKNVLQYLQYSPSSKLEKGLVRSVQRRNTELKAPEVIPNNSRKKTFALPAGSNSYKRQVESKLIEQLPQTLVLIVSGYCFIPDIARMVLACVPGVSLALREEELQRLVNIPPQIIASGYCLVFHTTPKECVLDIPTAEACQILARKAKGISGIQKHPLVDHTFDWISTVFITSSAVHGISTDMIKTVDRRPCIWFFDFGWHHGSVTMLPFRCVDFTGSDKLSCARFFLDTLIEKDGAPFPVLVTSANVSLFSVSRELQFLGLVTHLDGSSVHTST